MLNVAEMIQILKLKPHPAEGGFFRETYRSSFSTAIYYLLTPDTFSAMHKLPGDEIFHFYLGDPVEMLQLFPNGTSKINVLGNDISVNMQPQLIVPGNVWQGSRLISDGKFALLGTTMSPGFEFAHYIQGKRKELEELYPSQKNLIHQLTVT